MPRTLACRWCRDVIGVYEPMIVSAEGEVRETSRFNEPDGVPLGDCYHHACYLEAHGRAPPEQGD